MSWDEIRDPSPDFVDRVLSIVKTIPPGQVMTYGDIAAEIGSHADLIEATGSYGARLVGHVMSRFGSGVAWWRVIRSTGHPPRFHEAQAWDHYQREGTPLIGARDSYRIDLKQARFQPHPDTTGQTELDLF